MASRRRALRIVLVLLAACVIGVVWLGSLDPEPFESPGPPAPHPLPTARALSLLAVGDTGKIMPWQPYSEGMRSVGRGMTEVHRAAPAAVLVLLGDNFYPVGLREEELVERIRANLARPFCVFADLTGSRSHEVADACGLDTRERSPVPILAVLGNHDWKSPESPRLQREAIPEFLPNWSVNPGVADVVELGSGVSLVRVDSLLTEQDGSAAEVRDALRRAVGPWRILAVHEPIALREGEEPVPVSRATLRRAVAEADVPVQLVLSGHQHNLQVLDLALPRPALQVVAGGGSSRRPFKTPPFAKRFFGLETTGFARVDLLRDGTREGLLVALYSVPRYPFVFWRGARRVSRWWVDPSGEAYQVDGESPR